VELDNNYEMVKEPEENLVVTSFNIIRRLNYGK